jgi:replicative DNA helicase
MILNHLIFDEDYYIKTYHFIKPLHFKSINLRKIFEAYNDVVLQYHARPSQQDLLTALESDRTIEQSQYQDIVAELETISKEGKRIVLKQKMLDETIKHAQTREFLNFIITNAEKVKKDENYLAQNYGQMELEFKKISTINVDIDMGFDVFDRTAAENNFPKFRDINTMKSGFKTWDDITGGLEPGTLNVIQAPTNGGKSLTMAYLAAKYATQGFNVLYVTAEMSDTKISMRNQAALMDVELDMFRRTITDKDDYMKLFDMMCDAYPNHGKLWIKEYPTGTCNWLMIRNLIEQIQSGKNFEFDLVVVDYIMILNTTKKVSFDNSYAFQMAIAIELRGLSQMLKIPFLSAMQLTREALKAINKQQENASVGIEDMSGSLGVAFTIDTLITQVPLKKENSTQYLTDKIKQVYMWINSKTRSTGTKDDKFFVGVNGAKMSLYEIDSPDTKTTKLNESLVKSIEKDLNDWVDDFGDI